MPESIVCRCTDGQTYERRAIEEWFRRGNTTSPLTRADLSPAFTLTPNTAMRRATQRYRLEHVVAAMARGGGDDAHRARMLEEVALLARDEDNRQRLGEGCVCEWVVAVMRMAMQPRYTNRGTMEKALTAVANLAHLSQDSQRRLGAAGACERVVAAMANHPGDRDLMGTALEAALHLAGAGGSQANPGRLERAGVGDAAPAAITNHGAADRRLAERALALAASFPHAGIAGVREWVAVAVIRSHPADRPLVRQAAALVTAVAEGGANDDWLQCAATYDIPTAEGIWGIIARERWTVPLLRTVCRVGDGVFVGMFDGCNVPDADIGMLAVHIATHA